MRRNPALPAVAALLAGATLTACAPAPLTTEPAAATAVYRCAAHGWLTARFENGAVRLSFDDRTLVLPQTRAASGARFGDGPVVFWEKGGTAMFRTADGREDTCTADRPAPGAR